jgi:hypothetical protein
MLENPCKHGVFTFAGVPKTPFHAGNTGSNPVGDANKTNYLTVVDAGLKSLLGLLLGLLGARVGRKIIGHCVSVHAGECFHHFPAFCFNTSDITLGRGKM